MEIIQSTSTVCPSYMCSQEQIHSFDHFMLLWFCEFHLAALSRSFHLGKAFKLQGVIREMTLAYFRVKQLGNKDIQSQYYWLMSMLTEQSQGNFFKGLEGILNSFVKWLKFILLLSSRLDFEFPTLPGLNGLKEIEHFLSLVKEYGNAHLAVSCLWHQDMNDIFWQMKCI